MHTIQRAGMEGSTPPEGRAIARGGFGMNDVDFTITVSMGLQRALQSVLEPICQIDRTA